MTPSSS